MIPYKNQYINKADIQAVVEVLDSDFITQGTTKKLLETTIASYFEAKYAIVLVGDIDSIKTEHSIN